MKGFSYGSIGVQKLFVFSKLKLDPRRLWITISMPFGEGRVGPLSLVVDIEPPWAFWDEPGEDNNQPRENHLRTSALHLHPVEQLPMSYLQPDWNLP